jgi:hypothetical protein
VLEPPLRGLLLGPPVLGPLGSPPLRAAAFFDEWLAWPTCLPKERLSWSLPRYDIALATWAVGAGHPPATTIDVAVAERHPVAERHHNNRRCAESKHSGASPETETSAIKIIKK